MKTPLMLTGGFRSSAGMNAALSSGACDVIGLARSLAINPDFSRQLLEGKSVESEVRPLTTGYRALDKLFPLEVSWYSYQLQRMGSGKDPVPNLSATASIFLSMLSLGLQGVKRVRYN